jgi:hypothetical protein
MSRLFVTVLLLSLVFVFSETWQGDSIEGVEVVPQGTEEQTSQSAIRSVFDTLFKRNTDGSERHGQRRPNPPAPVQAGVCFVANAAVNMRSSPCGSSIVMLVPQGAVMTGNGGASNIGGGCSLGYYPNWQPVSYSGRSGYVATNFISGASCGGSPPPNPPPSGGGGGGSGSVTRNNVYNGLSNGAKNALQSIANTCGATVTPLNGGGGHCDFSINRDYSSCFQAARTQGYLSNFEFIWHPGASHCSSGQHLHILEGYHSHGIDRLYPATSADSINRKPSAAQWNSCQWLATITADANWCCYRWY